MFNKKTTKKSTIKIRYQQGAESKLPRKHVVSTLLDNSYSSEFDDARQEFSLETLIDESDESFSGCCQLCGTTGLKYNFVLINSKTGKRIQVGTTCIIRFGIGQGLFNIDERDGVQFLQNFANELVLINEIQTMVRAVMLPIPEHSELNKFYGNLKKFMDLRGINNPTMDQLREVFFGTSWEEAVDPIKLDRVKAIWNKPASITTHKNTSVKPLNNPKEGTTWGHKKRRNVSHHGGSSAIYKVEDYVIGKT